MYKMYKMYKEPKKPQWAYIQMFEERQKLIAARINVKDIKVSIGWAVNNAVQIMIAQKEKDFSNANIKKYSNDFLKLAQEMYNDKINEEGRKIELEEQNLEAEDLADNSPLNESGQPI